MRLLRPEAMRHLLPLCLLVLFNLSNSFANNFTITTNTLAGAVSFLETQNLERANLNNEIEINLLRPSEETPAVATTMFFTGSSSSSINPIFDSPTRVIYMFAFGKINRIDNSPKIHAENKIMVQPTCGLSNGSITNINVNGTFTKLFWLSENRDTLGTETDLKNVGEGKYKLIAVDETCECADSTEWLTLTNVPGPTLVTNNVLIKAATCGNPTGSISGITVLNSPGAQFIEWSDSTGRIVGNALDIAQLAAGKYRLRFKGEDACDTITTSYYIVKDTTEVIIDERTARITAVGCANPTGSIRNVTIINATSFSWRNMYDNSITATSRDIIDVGSGFYQLTARNAFGCSAISNGIYIPNASFDSIRVTSFHAISPGCNDNSGSITITDFNRPPNHQFTWLDSVSNQPLGTGTSLGPIGTGSYVLRGVDSNGCEGKIFSITLNPTQQQRLDESAVVLVNDFCSKGQGNIKGLVVENFTGATTFQWLDANNKLVGTSLELLNVVAGNYRLVITDTGKCSLTSRTFTLLNDAPVSGDPEYDNIVVARNSPATLAVKNFTPGNYLLFADAGGTVLVEQNQSGIFQLATVVTDLIFYIRQISGGCNSPLVRVTVTAVDKSYFAIPKAFSPNGDQLNDVLTVRVIGFLKIHYFIIYNRYGEPVFHTSTLNGAWDGTLNGTKLATGGYTWLAEGTDLEGKLVRDKGSVVLIR